MSNSLLKRKEPVIYLTILFTFLIGMFLFVPAVAVQKQDNGHGESPAQPADGGTGGEVSDDGEKDIQSIMKALEDRERELSKREEALKKDEERLNMLRSSVELSLKQYTAMRDRMQSSPAGNKPQDSLTRMARLYESMSVEEAAQRIEKMETDLAVNLLMRIKGKQAGKILGSISPDKAASLSARMASGKVDR
ncbi:MAG: hypothetical protein IT393_10065 [Nitrospirae bacterium]|nr:hypothetical protein [Nitrospirota bacterium]